MVACAGGSVPVHKTWWLHRALRLSSYVRNHAVLSVLSYGAYLMPLSCLAYVGCDDGSLADDNPIVRYSRLLNDAMIASGRVPSSEKLFRERLENAGFVDVQTFALPLPVGPWAKDRYFFIFFYFFCAEPINTAPAHSAPSLNRALKKLGVMMLLITEQGFYSYGMYTGECDSRCAG
jgi:hypothetical protein